MTSNTSKSQAPHSMPKPMIRIRFFGPGGIKSEWVFRCTVSCCRRAQNKWHTCKDRPAASVHWAHWPSGTADACPTCCKLAFLATAEGTGGLERCALTATLGEKVGLKLLRWCGSWLLLFTSGRTTCNCTQLLRIWSRLLIVSSPNHCMKQSRPPSRLWRPRPSCRCLLVLKSAGQAHFRTSAEDYGFHTKSGPLTGFMSPSSPTRPLLWTVTRRPSTIQTTIASLTSRRPHARALDCSVFPQCLKPLFRTFLMVILLFIQRESKESMLGNTLQNREKERKKKVLWSVLQSRCQRKVDGTVTGATLFRLTEKFILMNEISETTWNEELNKLFLVKIQRREKSYLIEYDMEIQNLERRNSECALIESQRKLEPQDDNYWKPINGQIKLSVRAYTCVVHWRWKSRLHQECYAGSCQEIEKLKKTLL